MRLLSPLHARVCTHSPRLGTLQSRLERQELQNSEAKRIYQQVIYIYFHLYQQVIVSLTNKSVAHTATVYRLQYLLAATDKHACAPADYGIASLLNYTLKEEEELLERLLDTERKLAEAMRVMQCEHDHKKSVHSELPDEVTTLKRKIDEYSVRESTLQQQVDSLNQVSLSFSEVYATEPCCDK